MYIYAPLCRYWIALYRYVLVFIVPHVDIELEDNKQFISNIPRISNTVFILQKRSESYEWQTRPIQTNSAHAKATRPIQTELGQYDSANNDDVISCFFSNPYKHGGRVLIDKSKLKFLAVIWYLELLLLLN